MDFLLDAKLKSYADGAARRSGTHARSWVWGNASSGPTCRDGEDQKAYILSVRTRC